MNRILLPAIVLIAVCQFGCSRIEIGSLPLISKPKEFLNAKVELLIEPVVEDEDGKSIDSVDYSTTDVSLEIVVSETSGGRLTGAPDFLVLMHNNQKQPFEIYGNGDWHSDSAFFLEFRNENGELVYELRGGMRIYSGPCGVDTVKIRPGKTHAVYVGLQPYQSFDDEFVKLLQTEKPQIFEVTAKYEDVYASTNGNAPFLVVSKPEKFSITKRIVGRSD